MIIKNKKGVAILVYFMIGILFFLLALALSGPLQEVVDSDNVMGTDGLNCSNTTISDQDKANCMSVDVMPPIYIAIILGLGAMLVARVIL